MHFNLPGEADAAGPVSGPNPEFTALGNRYQGTQVLQRAASGRPPMIPCLLGVSFPFCVGST